VVDARSARPLTWVVIWIISGPSSAGKSTFIQSARCRALTKLGPDVPVAIPGIEGEEHYRGSGDCFVHYNILRPAYLFDRERRRGEAGATDDYRTRATRFSDDPKWVELVGNRAPKQAIVLVANRKTLLERVQGRATRDKTELSRRELDYNPYYWLKLYDRINLPEVYQAWCAELERRRIPYLLLDANNSRYEELDPETALSTVSDEAPPMETSYTREEIETLLSREKFTYQRINLPHGLHTPGKDRSATRDLIFPKRLAGKSVLDVGSALGYFCFEAEAQGATRVLGVELNEERLRQALLLKDILGSKAEFIRRDVVREPLTEQFDCVFFLNVMHHLDEPVHVLAQLAAITRERLVIEFPTFADKRFRRNVGIRLPQLYNRLPLIGVSSRKRRTDQTFVFTPKAMVRILQDHRQLFTKVKIIDSPMRDRKIAICEK
jgi:2-polyprenyl-3-methyl-5-hydroxy-6-metoxy-1,4-benzoquinol methylase